MRHIIEPLEDIPDIYCDVCGHSDMDCECPECPICGEAGNIRCYINHGLVMSDANIARMMRVMQGQPAVQIATCKWTKVWPNMWHTECKVATIRTDIYDFCPYCGKRIVTE